MRAFADYLQQCNMATEHISGLNILNDCRENRKMLTKLPKWLIRRWRRIVSKYTHSYPSFSEFCLFVNKEADIICNPILCSLQETDSQSDSTFILDSVSEELKARSVDVDLKLSTMTTTSTIKCQKINNLRIRGFYSEKILSIPIAYTRDVIPINRLHIPTNMTASKWSHLQCLKNKIPVNAKL